MSKDQNIFKKLQDEIKKANETIELSIAALDDLRLYDLLIGSKKMVSEKLNDLSESKLWELYKLAGQDKNINYVEDDKSQHSVVSIQAKIKKIAQSPDSDEYRVHALIKFIETNVPDNKKEELDKAIINVLGVKKEVLADAKTGNCKALTERINEIYSSKDNTELARFKELAKFQEALKEALKTNMGADEYPPRVLKDQFSMSFLKRILSFLVSWKC
ncbi:MAG: hypothetical protein IPP74_00230 [Alphaproteobacteria bacterium]|nr:hypothetical protein [Alphaproteobacteria bacterium]